MEEQQIKRARRKSVEIKLLLEEFAHSRVSAKDFCLQHNITEKCFCKWRSRYADTSSTGLNGFVSLKQHAAPQAVVGIQLFAEVHGIRIYQPVTSSYLKELLS